MKTINILKRVVLFAIVVWVLHSFYFVGIHWQEIDHKTIYTIADYSLEGGSVILVLMIITGITLALLLFTDWTEILTKYIDPLITKIDNFINRRNIVEESTTEKPIRGDYTKSIIQCSTCGKPLLEVENANLYDIVIDPNKYCADLVLFKGGLLPINHKARKLAVYKPCSYNHINKP